ncbi:MAG: formate/nitrite transporter family protein [Eubacteriaceae bacterium]|nr:formate/nitrite transporter family protein [Eubacteriaceae bacterium]
MEVKTSPPSEIAQTWIATGVAKAKSPALKLFILGIFAGVFIGLGGTGYLYIMGMCDIPGINKLLGASVFPCGLMLVIYCGAELWTGNNLLTLALMDKKITLSEMLYNWGLVYLGNIVGSYLLAWAVTASGLFSSDPILTVVQNVAAAKVGLTLGRAVIRGVLCNILVVLACWMQAASRDLIGKLIAVWFPIMLFVLIGFEHSIANMFFIPLGQFLGASVTFADAWLRNILPVTVGNFIGGALIVPCAYYICYVNQSTSQKPAPPQQQKKKK